MRRHFVSAGLAGMLGFSGASLAADKVTFGTNWLAEAEHGGYYQAVVDGTYAKYGLDVTILPGGPQANNRMLLVTSKIDFYMGGNMIQALEAVEQNIPTIVVAAAFQKDPQIFMSHPGAGLDKWTDLPKATAFVGKEGLALLSASMISDAGSKEMRIDEIARTLAANRMDHGAHLRLMVTRGEKAAAMARAFTTAWSSPPIFVSRVRTRKERHQPSTPPARSRLPAALGKSGKKQYSK